MKYIVVKDSHGNIDLVKRGVESLIKQTQEPTKLIYMGDYVDSYVKKNNEIIDSLNLLISIKKALTSDVILLFGNHDFQYLQLEKYFRCSGFRESMVYTLHDIFSENKKLFQFYHHDKEKKILFTHAGLNKKWLQNVVFNHKKFADEDPLVVIDNLTQSYDGLLHLAAVGEARGGVRYDAGGILWCDKTELLNNPYFNDDIKIQVVGHSIVEDIQEYNINQNKIYFVDNTKDKLFFI